ncbi:unnamed protein product [Sympodiomycopsis kandeliae]
MAISPHSSPNRDSQPSVIPQPRTPTQQGPLTGSHLHQLQQQHHQQQQHQGHATPSRRTPDSIGPLSGPHSILAISPRKRTVEQDDHHSKNAATTPRRKAVALASLSTPVEAGFFHSKSRSRTNSGKTIQQPAGFVAQADPQMDEKLLLEIVRQFGLDKQTDSFTTSTVTTSETGHNSGQLQPAALLSGGSYPPANDWQELRQEYTYNAPPQGQSQATFERHQAVSSGQSTSCVPTDLSRLRVQGDQRDNGLDGAVSQYGQGASADNEAWIWQNMQQGQQNFPDTFVDQYNEQDRSPFVNSVHPTPSGNPAIPLGSYNPQPFGFSFHDDDEEQAALRCFQQLERLTAEQALRVLNSVRHLFEGEANGFTGFASNAAAILPPTLPHFPQYPHAQHNQYEVQNERHQSRQGQRTIYGTMPAPPRQGGSSTSPRNAVHHGVGIHDSEAAQGSALAAEQRPSTAPGSQRANHAPTARTPPEATEHRSLSPASDANRSTSRASVSTPRPSLFRPPPIAPPTRGASDAKGADGCRAVSECLTDSQVTDSRSATPASASTTATSVVTRGKSTSEDPDTSTSFDGTKTISPTYQWYGTLNQCEIADLQERFGHIVLCPGFTTGFAKVIDSCQRVIIPGSTQGYKVTIKRMERYMEKASDVRFSWWPQALSDLNMEEIFISDVLKGLDHDRWEQYRQAYKTQVTRRSSLAKSPSVKKRPSDEFDAMPGSSLSKPNKRRKSDATAPVKTPPNGMDSPKKVSEKLKSAKAKCKEVEGNDATLKAEKESPGALQD